MALLGGVTIGVDTGARALRIAARWLCDLGATTFSLAGATADPADDAWLGTLSPLPARQPVDVLLRQHGSVAFHRPFRTVVVLSGSGATAPEPNRPLTEAEACAAGGIAVAIGEPDKPPLPLPTGALDSLVGAQVAAAAIACLIDGCRETAIAAADVAAWLVATNIKMYEPYGAPWYRAGRRASGCGGCYPYALFEANDGLFCLIGRTEAHWHALTRMIESRSLDRQEFRDPRLIARTLADEADAHVAPWVGRRTRRELLEEMAQNRFPGGPIYTCSEVLALESLSSRWRRFTDETLRSPPQPFTVVEGSTAPTEKRLDGLKVLDLSWVWSGPAATTALGDLGANVVKVESSSRPDNTRLRGSSTVRPPRHDVPPLEATEYFHALNRGKRSVALDLKTDEGKRILSRLACQADVILENLPPGVMARWGIEPETVLETNPACTFVSMRGFGDEPLLRDLRAYAPVLTGAAGIEDLVRYDSGATVGAMTVAFSDALAASHALLLALAGVHSANRHRRGAAITLSQFEGAVTANGRNLVDEQRGGVPPLASFGDTPEYVVSGEAIAESPWVSRGLFADVSSAWLGRLSVCRLPWQRNGTFPRVESAAPELGRDTHLVLEQWLGIDKAVVDQLVACGASR